MEIWKPRTLITNKEKQNILFFSRMFNIHPVTTYLIYARGHHTQNSIRHFLYPSFNLFSTPFLIKDLEKGVERLIKAIYNRENIGVFGDYDADGITSTSMLCKALNSLGGICLPNIPLRKDGYGLSKKAVNHFKSENISLIITLDNGSSCYEEVTYANQLGIDVIIVDHHDILKNTPPAFAFINPKREDDSSGLDYLSGAGVTFYFIEGLYKKMSLPWNVYIQEYVELATIGTICDMVPLVDENRLLCDMGLKKLNFNPSPAMKFLKNILKIKHFDSSTISFDIGPLINGFGRYDNPNLIIPLFVTDDWNDWLEKKCLSLNHSRKKISYEQTLLAENIVQEQNLNNNDILHIHGDFHEGILGVIASKFSKKYKKPTLVSSLNGKGSARSIPNSQYSIIDLLASHENYFIKHGGHQLAAGFSLKEHSIDVFHQSISSVKLSQSLLNQHVLYDMELDINQFNDTLYEELSFLEPFGIGNPKPIFKSNDTFFHNVECFGKYDTHLRCTIDNINLFSFFADTDDISTLSFNSFDILYSPLKAGEFTIESIRSNEENPFPNVI